MRISLNGFDASFIIGRKPAPIGGIVTDRTARTVEGYIQAKNGVQFWVSWKCPKTMPPSQGDVWIDGVWVGSRRINPHQDNDEGQFLKAELRQEARASEEEDVGRKFVFDIAAIKEAEKKDDGGAHLINSILGLGASSKESESSKISQAMNNSLIDHRGGPGELRLVITRAEPLHLSETNSEPPTLPMSPVPITKDTVLTERIATFIFKFRSKGFLNEKDIFHRPSIDKHLINDEKTLLNGMTLHSSDGLETKQSLDWSVHGIQQDRRRPPKRYKTFKEMRMKFRNFFGKKEAMEAAKLAALNAHRKSEVMTRSMKKKSVEAAASEKGRPQVAETESLVNCRIQQDVKVEEMDTVTAFGNHIRQGEVGEKKESWRKRKSKLRLRALRAAKREQKRSKRSNKQGASAASDSQPVLVVEEQAMDVTM